MFGLSWKEIRTLIILAPRIAEFVRDLAQVCNQHRGLIQELRDLFDRPGVPADPASVERIVREEKVAQQVAIMVDRATERSGN